MHPDAHDDERRITYFAATHTRGKREMFGIRSVDRGKHVYVIGKTGMGKSTMLENMAIQDIQHGEGIAFIDPHGSTAEKLLDFVPHDRIKDVVYFAPFDTEYPLGFNVMEDVGFEHRHLVVSGLMGAFKRIWVDAWSARMEYILQNTLLALLEYPGTTLIDVNRMLTNKTFRNAVVDKVTDPIVKAFWTEEFAAFTDTYTREATPAIQNKIGAFVSNPLIRNIIGQSTSSFDPRKIMDEKKIFIVNLSKGRMGESNASLLGSMLTVKIYLAAMSRAEEPPSRMAKLPRCFFYVDEFQSMMNEAFADILSEARKYKLALTLANQYIEQMEEEVRDAVFGNVGTLITFRVGPFDAETLKTVFEPTFEAEDLVNLGIGQIYLTLMIDGVGSPPFSAETIPPIEKPHISYREDVITSSREAYGRSRASVEEAIAAKQKEFIPPPVLSKTQIRKMESGGSSYGSRPREALPVVSPISIMRAANTASSPAPVARAAAPVSPRPVSANRYQPPAEEPVRAAAPERQSSERQQERPIVEINERAYEGSAEPVAARPPERTFERSNHYPAPRPAGYYENRPTERPHERSAEFTHRPVDRPSERPSDRAPYSPAERPQRHENARPSERPEVPAAERAERPAESPSTRASTLPPLRATVPVGAARPSAGAADQRSALRAAIDGARSRESKPASAPAAPTLAPIRSPADLLRARMQRPVTPSPASRFNQQEHQQSFRSTDFRSARPVSPPPPVSPMTAAPTRPAPRPPERPRTPAPESTDFDAEKDSGEISPELLKRVISGDRGHEEDTDT